MIQDRNGSGKVLGKERSRSPRGDDDAALLAASGVTAGTSDPAGTPDVSKLVSDSVRKAMAAEQGKLAEICQNVCDATCSDLGAKLQKSVDAVDQRCARIEGSLEALNKTVNAALAKLGHSDSAPSLGASSGNMGLNIPVPGDGEADVTTPTFFRKLDPTILYVNVHGQVQVAREKFFSAIVALAAEANIQENKFVIVGDAMDNKFELKFMGDFCTCKRTAAARALQFFESLKLGRGKWKPQQVKGINDVVHQFYVQPDKNGAQIKREILSKELANIFSSIVQSSSFFVRKSTGSVFVDRRVLATVHVTGENQAKINWFHPKRIQLSIKQEEVEEQFYALLGGPSYS